MIDPSTYCGYRGLPTLAGIAEMSAAVRPGLSIEECVTRLKRFHYAFKRLHGILTARITAEPIYELKTAFSLHAYLCAEHVDALRIRVGEMREPPLGLDEIPHPAFEILFDEILGAPTTTELLIGIYEHALPYLAHELDRYRRDTHPIADAPSIRVCRFAALEVADMVEYGRKAIAAIVSAADRSAATTAVDGLQACRSALEAADHPVPPRIRSAVPYRYDPVPRRDERWQDLWNQGVNPEAFLYDPAYPADAKSLMMLYKRIREVDVPEMMASIISETPGKPWRYYRDMSRQLWDEARHAMLGEVGFTAIGVDWTQARITHNWSMRLNTECTPMERHAVLYFIEQGLMTRTGKRYEWEVGCASGIPLMATIQDFDWADEVLHAAIGRQWYIPEFGNINKALEYGDQCWSRILSNWHAVREQGLTGHDNWWPTVYQQACSAGVVKWDSTVAAYNTTYEGTRADLKNVSS